MRDPSRTAVLGPLAPFADGFVVELSALGYTAGSAVQQMCLMAHLSRWLDAEGLLTGAGFAAVLSAAAGCGAGGADVRAGRAGGRAAVALSAVSRDRAGLGGGILAGLRPLGSTVSGRTGRRGRA